MDWGEFLSFRKMITPSVIQILFWIGVIVCVLAGLASIVGGSYLPGPGGTIYGLLVLFVGPIIVRVYCEILIVVFRIHDSLAEIQKNTARR